MKKARKLKTTGTVHDTPTGFDFEIDPPLGLRKAVRYRCLDCCAGSPHEVRLCPSSGCALWPFRMGRGIADKDGTVTTRERSPKQREVAQQNAQKMLAAKSKKKTAT